MSLYKKNLPTISQHLEILRQNESESHISTEVFVLQPTRRTDNGFRNIVNITMLCTNCVTRHKSVIILQKKNTTTKSEKRVVESTPTRTEKILYNVLIAVRIFMLD